MALGLEGINIMGSLVEIIATTESLMINVLFLCLMHSSLILEQAAMHDLTLLVISRGSTSEEFPQNGTK